MFNPNLYDGCIRKLKEEIAKGIDVEDANKTLSEIDSLISYISIFSEGDDKKKEKSKLDSLKKWVEEGGVHPDDKKNKGDGIKKKAEKKNPFFEKFDDVEKLYIYVDSIKKTTDRELSRMEAGLPKEVFAKTDVEKLLDLKRKAEELEAKIKLEALGNTGKKTVSFNNVSSGKDKTAKSVEGLARLSTLIQFISKDLKISELDLIKSLALHLKKGEISRKDSISLKTLEIRDGKYLQLSASAKDIIDSFADGKVPDGFNELKNPQKGLAKMALKDAQETKAWLDQDASISNNSVILF